MQNNEINTSPIRRSIFNQFQEKANDKISLPESVINSPESSPLKAPIDKRGSMINLSNLKSKYLLINVKNINKLTTIFIP
jgi:hypothetical protein